MITTARTRSWPTSTPLVLPEPMDFDWTMNPLVTTRRNGILELTIDHDLCSSLMFACLGYEGAEDGSPGEEGLCPLEGC